MVEFNFDPDQLTDNYAANKVSRDAYEDSEEYAQDVQAESFRAEVAPVATKETAKAANNDDSGIIGSTVNFVKHAGIGVAKGVEEIGQTFRLLKDNAFHLPKPETTAESLAQGFGQFLPAFIPAAGALGVGIRAAGLVGKTKKIRTAVEFLKGSAAGAIADASAYDPKDPNVANFLLVTGAISQDSGAGAAIKTLLAQDNSDTEAIARIKAAASGLIAGSIVTGIIKATGHAVTRVRGEITHVDGTPIEVLKKSSEVEANTFTDGVLKSKGIDVGDGGPTYNISQEMNKKFGEGLPSIEGSFKDTAERSQNDYVAPFEKLTPEQQLDFQRITQKWAKTREVAPVDLKTIESMNLLKLKTRSDVRNMLQFMSTRMGLKDLKGSKTSFKDLDTSSGAAEMLGLPNKEMVRIIDEQGGNIRNAMRYVGAARAFSSAAMKKAEVSFEAFVATGKSVDYEEGLTHTEMAYDMLAAGGDLAKASSDLLRSHKNLVDDATALADVKKALRHSVIYNDPELSIRQAGFFVNAVKLDTVKITAKFPGGAKQTRKIPKIEGESSADFKKRAIMEAKRAEFDDIANATNKQAVTRANAMNKSFKARGRDAMLEIYINGLLSSAKTFEVNLLGNSTAIVTSVIERSYAGYIKRGGEVTGQEAAQLAKGFWNQITAFDDLWKLMKLSWDKGPTGNMKQDFIKPRDRTLSAEGMRVGGNLGKAINVFGSVVNFPGRILLTADDIFKTVNSGAEKRALAYRKAVLDTGTQGETVQDAVAVQNRFNEIYKNIEDHEDILEGAKSFAEKNTFTNPLQMHQVKQADGTFKPMPGLGLRLKAVLDSDPSGIARVFVPFFQTPANLLNFAWERTPILRKLNKGLQAELSADAPAAVRELAEAKVATSRVMWATTFGLAMSGNFTGGPPADKNLRKTLEADMGGNAHWYSFQLGGKWYKYDRFDPIGVIIGASANMAIMAKASMNLAGLQDEDDESGAIREEQLAVLEAGTIGMVKLIADRHYLQSFSEMLAVFSGEGSTLGKVQKAGEKVSSVFNPIQALSTGFYSSFRRNITQGLEPEKLTKLQRGEIKDFEDVVEEMKTIFEEGLRRVTPGYGTKLPTKNLAGETVLYPGMNYELDRKPFQILGNIAKSVFAPSAGNTPSKSPLINALARLQSTTGQPSGVNRINGILLTDEEKGYFVDTWTDRNKRLNAFVTSKNFLSLPEGLQRDIVENQINGNKRLASKLTMVKFNRIFKGALDLKRNDLLRKTEDVPRGLNLANIRGQ
tara:strand:+ start:4301 stop:8092 length:3792 start_codon:yes stop_codon:yes gene_type:complete